MTQSLPIRIATRGSALAVAQAQFIHTHCLAAFPGLAFEIRIIKTTGDKLQAASLASSELPKGLFTKELEEALLRGEADLAVHSLKDLPTELPAGLKLGAVTARADPRDVLVYRDLEHLIRNVDPQKPVRQQHRGFRPALTLQGLPARATVATSSTRRAAQARELRPDLNIVPIRGNVGTRLRKVAEQPELDATLLAAAGLQRLQIRMTPAGRLEGEDLPAGLAATLIDLDTMLPCVGQAAIGIETREQDQRMDDICVALNHAETQHCVLAERAFLEGMGGGCHLAVAAFAGIKGSELTLRGVSYLGAQPRRGDVRGRPEAAVELGKALAVQLLAGETSPPDPQNFSDKQG